MVWHYGCDGKYSQASLVFYHTPWSTILKMLNFSFLKKQFFLYLLNQSFGAVYHGQNSKDWWSCTSPIKINQGGGYDSHTSVLKYGTHDGHLWWNPDTSNGQESKEQNITNPTWLPKDRWSPGFLNMYNIAAMFLGLCFLQSTEQMQTHLPLSTNTTHSKHLKLRNGKQTRRLSAVVKH